MGFFKKIIIGFSVFILFFYIFLGFILYVKQKDFIYFPDNSKFEACKNFPKEEQTIFGSARFFYKKNSDRIAVFYHGNADTACRNIEIAKLFEKAGYSYIIAEYAGYSGGEGQPSLAAIKNNVADIDKFIKHQNFKSIALAGYSLGSGVASYHHNLSASDKLILIAGFDSLENYGKNFFPYNLYPMKLLLTEKYDNLKWTNDALQTLIICGSEDEVMPEKFSRSLYKNIISKDKDFLLVPAGHNVILENSDVQNKIISFLSF